MKVAILAGGTGTRLAEETEIKPKPMVEIGGRPILWHIMKHYAHYGFNESIGPRKNVGLVIEALARVPSLRPKLVWIGNSLTPEYLAKLKLTAQAGQVDFECRLLIDDDALIDLLNRAQLMVYAPKLEPFGFGPLEANACGLPVIAVAEGGVRETVIDGINGLLVEPDPQSMAEAIEHLMKQSYGSSTARSARS